MKEATAKRREKPKEKNTSEPQDVEMKEEEQRGARELDQTTLDDLLTAAVRLENLRVVKTSTTSIIVQWEKAQGEIDRYVLSVAPNQTDGSSGPREMALPPERDSAQIEGLHAGRLYEVAVVAERGSTRSLPARAQATPGPEPPSALLFSDVTDSSFTVSWKKPKSKVSGFKITHTHVQEGEPISVSVDSETLRLDLSSRAPGSTYEVRVMSVLGQDESDPITDSVTTLPDAPTHLQAINVTDSKALLIWRPALATVDHYRIIYSPEAAPDSAVSISVSGNAAQHHLQSLHSSTRYTVSISSRRGEQSSSSSSTAFSTTSGAGWAEDGPRDLKATQVTPRSAVLSWRPPESPISGYRLSYYTDQQDKKELVLDAGVSELHLRRLVPSSVYTAQLQAERAGLHTHTVHTHFTTGSLRFPFPTDCSQERQNGALESGPVEVFPQGRSGRPLRVYCDMETDGGGWTVFQRRKDGQTNFFRRWREYSSGFGTLDGEFWMGNELLHNFTQSVPMELRVDLRAGAESAFAQYSSFTIDTAKRHYTLRIAGYSGTAGDSLSYHSGRPFSARDRDPRPFITRCAMSYRGGWWYKNCHEANLNGLYNTSSNHQGVIWTAWKGQDFSIPFTEMKFRPASFKP
ncbi:tenascin [Danio aesculapii]|uniref:tenascin n=1 Tax=Danio aesculapii TaxID=1142201 RepID=UPI0024BFDD5F|nr:tenascin [Danio aesculapii]